jgi:hypothetical protein
LRIARELIALAHTTPLPPLPRYENNDDIDLLAKTPLRFKQQMHHDVALERSPLRSLNLQDRLTCKRIPSNAKKKNPRKRRRARYESDSDDSSSYDSEGYLWDESDDDHASEDIDGEDIVVIEAIDSHGSEGGASSEADVSSDEGKEYAENIDPQIKRQSSSALMSETTVKPKLLIAKSNPLPYTMEEDAFLAF